MTSEQYIQKQLDAHFEALMAIQKQILILSDVTPNERIPDMGAAMTTAMDALAKVNAIHREMITSKGG